MLTEGEDITEEKARNISKKMFIGGFFLLPWLWLVNVLLFFSKYRSPSTPSDIKWYIRNSFFGFLVYTGVFLIWMIVYLTQRNNWGVTGDTISLVIPNGK